MNNQETLKKYVGAIVKGGIVSVPLVGSLAVELLNVTIPNQREERIEKLLLILSSKVFDIAPEQLEEKFNSPDFVDIFEDILFQSVRATSSERLEHLASVVEYGLRQEEIDHLQIKRLLEILKEINDVEVILLQSYESRNRYNQDFKEKHSSIFDLVNLEPDKVQEHKVMLENYNSHLINLGLIGKSSSFDSFSRNRQISEYDLCITELGRMLLKKIGIEQDENGLIGEPINPMDAINSALKKLEQKEKEIKRELEEDAKKAKRVMEKEISRFNAEIRRHTRLFYN
jgi:hypothetical protein